MALSSSKKIKPRQIEAFRAAIQHGSASAAAESLFITQPAVSRLLSDLEHALGFALFERQARGLQATADGRRLLQVVDRVYEGLNVIEEAAVSIRSGKAGQIRVGALPVYSGGILAEQTGSFIATHPGIKVELRSVDRDVIVEGLLTSRFDLALSTIPTKHEGIDEIKLGDRKALCILPASHPLASQKKISLRNISEEPFIGLTESNPFREVIDGAVNMVGSTLNKVAMAQTQRAVGLMVGAGAGISIVDPEVCQYLAPDKVVSRPLEPGIGWTFGILKPKRIETSVAAKKFIDHLQKNIR